MFPIPIATPTLIKYGVIALAVLTLTVSSYVMGRKHVRAAWDAERAANALVAAQAAAVAEERERVWTNAAVVAGEKYAQQITQIQASGARARAELNRMRESSGGSRVPGTTEAAASCSRAGGATRDELLGYGATVIELAEAADRARAGLMACLESWPR